MREVPSAFLILRSPLVSSPSKKVTERRTHVVGNFLECISDIDQDSALRLLSLSDVRQTGGRILTWKSWIAALRVRLCSFSASFKLAVWKKQEIKLFWLISWHCEAIQHSRLWDMKVNGCFTRRLSSTYPSSFLTASSRSAGTLRKEEHRSAMLNTISAAVLDKDCISSKLD